MLVTILCIVISITAFSVTKKPKKSRKKNRKKTEPNRGNTICESSNFIWCAICMTVIWFSCLVLNSYVGHCVCLCTPVCVCFYNPLHHCLTRIGFVILVQHSGLGLKGAGTQCLDSTSTYWPAVVMCILNQHLVTYYGIVLWIETTIEPFWRNRWI